MKIEIFYEDNSAVAVEVEAANLNVTEKELRICSKAPIKPKYAKEIYVNGSKTDPLAMLCNRTIDGYGPLLVVGC